MKSKTSVGAIRATQRVQAPQKTPAAVPPTMEIHPRLVPLTIQVPPVIAEALMLLSRLKDKTLNEYVIDGLATIIRSDFEEAGNDFSVDLESQMACIAFDRVQNMCPETIAALAKKVNGGGK